MGIDDHEIVLQSDMYATVDGNPYQAEEMVHLGDKNPDFKVVRVGNALRVESRKYPFWALLDSNSNIKIGVSEELSGRVNGLCGFMDGLPENDQQTPDGRLSKSTQEFGDSWIIFNSTDCNFKVFLRV